MRLLKIGDDGSLSLTKDLIDNIPPYAILSHTWGEDEEEVSYQDFIAGPVDTKVGYRKIEFCKERATHDGLQYFWIDTCCINKSNHAELAEAIISMFRWYQNSTKCYVYLADVSFRTPEPATTSSDLWLPAFRNSRWFTRGWTLQELIAPSVVDFYSLEGTFLGDKMSLVHDLQQITGIATQALRGHPVSHFSVAERFSWAKSRDTKRGEDKAYSLLGIFEVFMFPLYGEGVNNSFCRLNEEISKSCNLSQAAIDSPNSLTAQSIIQNAPRSWNFMSSSRVFNHESVVRQLLSDLRFSAIEDRQGRIPSALAATCQWIFRDPEVDDLQDYKHNFVEWLRGDSPLYWITGKAGSGKSTLMKFIQSDPRSRNHAMHWAQSSTLIIAGHFFWNSGDSNQMSIEGLVRTILHGIGTQVPHLLHELFPERWAKMELSSNIRSMVSTPWTLPECLHALRKLLAPPFDQFKFLIFVDGMDECSGDHDELTTLLKEMATFRHIKMCLASRPWNVFQDAFNTKESLILEYLNKPDIWAYVKTKFNESTGFQELQNGNPQLATILCDEITQKASGVFLWVFLAVKTLLRGIADGDRDSDLMRRLRDLPEDLEMLFEKIMNSVDPEYRAHSAELFRIHRSAMDEIGDIGLLTLACADEDRRFLWDDMDQRKTAFYLMKSMGRRLSSRTKGLLEAKVPDEQDCDGPIMLLASEPRVQYLHRTLKDYIERPNVWARFCLLTPSFSPIVSLCKGYTLRLKLESASFTEVVSKPLKRSAQASPNINEEGTNIHSQEKTKHTNNEYRKEMLNEFPKIVMFLCSISNDWESQALIPILDALDRIVALNHLPNYKPTTMSASKEPPLLMALAVEYDIHFWIEALLQRGHHPSAGRRGESLLSVAIDDKNCLARDVDLFSDSDVTDRWREDIIHPPSFKCLDLLLPYAADDHVRDEYGEIFDVAVTRFSDVLQPRFQEYSDTRFDKEYGALVETMAVFCKHGFKSSLYKHGLWDLICAWLDPNEMREADDRLCQILDIKINDDGNWTSRDMKTEQHDGIERGARDVRVRR